MATSPSNSTFSCPPPFLSNDDYPPTGGYVGGRLCYPLGATSCCVPCPLTDWIFAHGFNSRMSVGNWINVAALFATTFLLLSFAFLDKKWTNKHYLSVCLTIGVLFIEVGFIIPLIAKPPACYDPITPNEPSSNVACGFIGSFIYFGAWSAVMWIFWRALFIHLQICWNFMPAQRFFYTALGIGWGIPALGVSLVLGVSGVSYRFANTCHINHKYGLGIFWIPLLIIAAVTLVMQFATIFYCCHIFMRNMIRDRASNEHKNQTPSAVGSFGSVETYRRVKRLVRLQWKGASIVMVILAEVTFFSIVFVSMDKNTDIKPGTPAAMDALQWATCLIREAGDADKCLNYAAKLVITEATIIAVLIFIGLSGFWCLLFLGRWSMVLGWRDLIRRKMFRQPEDASDRPGSADSDDERGYKVHDSKRSSAAVDTRASRHVSLLSGMTRGVVSMSSEPPADDVDVIERKSSVDAGEASSPVVNPLSDTPRASLQPYTVQQSRLSSPAGREMPATALPEPYTVQPSRFSSPAGPEVPVTALPQSEPRPRPQSARQSYLSASSGFGAPVTALPQYYQP